MLLGRGAVLFVEYGLQKSHFSPSILLFSLVFAQIASGQEYRSAEYYNQPPADPSDPCHFPTPDQRDMSAMCRFDYHQVPFICDPTAMLSRTEAQVLEKAFSDVAISGCLACQRTIEGCIDPPGMTEGHLRVSVIIVPVANVHRIENCINGPRHAAHMRKEQAVNAYAEFVFARWSESGCASDLTILYLKQLQYPLRNGGMTKSGPMTAKIFRNRLSEVGQMNLPVQHISADHTLLEVLTAELNQSFALARAEERFRAFGKKKNFGGVPTWAYIICGALLAMVVVMLYFGNCITKRLNLKAQQKKSMNNRNQAQAANQQGNGERWRAGFGGGLISQNNSNVQNNNPSAMSNMGVQNTKSSMMFRQFSNANAKKQRAKAAALVQKI
ncbi:unnamed protein product [Bursaphelenchus xylophilus]|uniref:(pine wood nematode) hypothetical protein n=1 Tax=Bursaphelenchus xylophilus TaxID=6326 RepID=A0A1I7RVV3_BURXY|nr:unnamed protein product [Bursaphelenchus xylophilus]CAG9094743.1 unnamed protein product [Bursaphelenchus xylophilus]